MAISTSICDNNLANGISNTAAVINRKSHIVDLLWISSPGALLSRAFLCVS